MAPLLPVDVAGSRLHVGCVPGKAEAIAPLSVSEPSSVGTKQIAGHLPDITLAQLRDQRTIATQAQRLTETVDSQKMGMYTSTKLLKRGWSRKGGESAPLVPTPWPHDYVLGHGIDRNLSYKDLDIFQWQQGYFAILELIQNYPAKMLAMISHMKFIFQLRSTMARRVRNMAMVLYCLIFKTENTRGRIPSI
jgi:hypothetical protein